MHHRPDHIKPDFGIAMDQAVTHAGDFAPRDFGVAGADVGRDFSSGKIIDFRQVQRGTVSQRITGHVVYLPGGFPRPLGSRDNIAHF